MDFPLRLWPLAFFLPPGLKERIELLAGCSTDKWNLEKNCSSALPLRGGKEADLHPARENKLLTLV